MKKVLIIAGPTASGKSSLALALAQRLNGVIINGDSMQLYTDLRLLTACPSLADKELIPHYLYNTLAATESNSVWAWLQRVDQLIQNSSRLPIIVGGTGMYLRALEQGVVALPDIPLTARDQANALFDEVGEDAFRISLSQKDPQAAALIVKGDRQRLVRAWSVVQETGISLTEWKKKDHWKPQGVTFIKILVEPERQKIYSACDERFQTMVAEGALDEVKHLLSMNLSPDLPVMKAIGVQEFSSYLQGKMTMDEAVLMAQQATRQYAKRQLTWFRHQYKPHIHIKDGVHEGLEEQICSLLDSLPS